MVETGRKARGTKRERRGSAECGVFVSGSQGRTRKQYFGEVYKFGGWGSFPLSVLNSSVFCIDNFSGKYISGVELVNLSPNSPMIPVLVFDFDLNATWKGECP